jgi:N-acetylmuramic acid 6-phosphate etherase
MKQKEVVLAVDGGGTKTQALIADLDGNILGRGLGPGSNSHRDGFEEGCKAVRIAAEAALQSVTVGRSNASGEPAWRRARIVAACFGLAGIDGPEDEAEFSGWVRREAITDNYRVLNDSELILAGGTPDGFGVALISGTGSVCLGRTPEGRSHRTGGWGPLLGDEGSGYAMALQALRFATQTQDGRADATALLKAVLQRWTLPNADALIRRVHAPTTTQSEIAGLAVDVLKLAATGDPYAQSIVEQGAKDLALHVDTVIRRLGIKRPPLALAGGVLRVQFRTAVQAAVQSELGPVQYVADPSMGALTLALRLLKAKR